ncbi:MAG: DEAD/DEAH box helicase family protein [Microbacteriaceae bacterium]|nr:DEAD/DEAH box helicase family protein [Microbacteriaceae bacterium]
MKKPRKSTKQKQGRAMLTFDYHPLTEEIELPLSQAEFARAVVMDEAVSKLYDHVSRIRISSEIVDGIPSGLFWFTGLPEPILMQVGSGKTGESQHFEVEEWDDSLQHPLVEVLKWAEHLWANGKDIPVPKFAVGDRVIAISGSSDLEIKGRVFDANSWSYKVFGEGGNRSELEKNLQLAKASDDPEDWVLTEPSAAARFGATLTRAKLKGRFLDTVYSYSATRTVFRPYQFKPVLKLLRTGRARILIADEVGLGKTIEAGLIWTELEARHEADRVLIVCPSGLTGKWRDEMQDRFNFDVTHLNSTELKRFAEQHRENRLPRRKAYVASLESLRTSAEIEEFEDNPPEFDLVIVDEAHSMRNSDTKSYELGAQLSEWTTGSNMVFLTATPINLRQTDLLNLLELLEPGDFDSLEVLESRLEPNLVLNGVGRMLTDTNVSAASFETELSKLSGMAYERAVKLRPEYAELEEILKRAPLAPKDIVEARRLIGDLNTLSTTVTRTRRAEVEEDKPIRDSEPGIEIVWTPAESDFYEEYLQWCERRAELAGTATYFAMQMPIRLASTSVHIAARDVLSRADADIWEGDVERKSKSNWIPPHENLIDAARKVLNTPDSKLKRLRTILLDLSSQNRQALLFSWSKAALRYLQVEFKDDFRIAILNGDVRPIQRRKIMKDFRDGKYEFIFANKVASEGLDFEFCSAVINYDIPWNPMEIEQRIGRIDRIGQESEKIVIRTFYNDEAIDSRILYRVLQRIHIFEESIGELEPIIGEHMEVLHSAIDFRLTEEEREQKAQQFLIAIEARRNAVRDIADNSAGLIISNDVQVEGLKEELLESGRYLGQVELANLLDDWAKADGASAIHWATDGKSIELVGNAAMAARVKDLTQKGVRSRNETQQTIANLQNQSPILLSTNQELARTSEIELLSATHPLVLAATDLPDFHHVRFATAQISATEKVPSGEYLVLISHAENARRGGDEIWGVAIRSDGTSAGEEPADALLAALARGEIRDSESIKIDDLPRLVRRAKRELDIRHKEVQDRRDEEEDAWREARLVLLGEQFERRKRSIQKRKETLIRKKRSESLLVMAEGQLRRGTERYENLVAEIRAQKPKALSLKHVAVCVLEVTR